MTKIVLPCTHKIGSVNIKAFAKITYSDKGRLSISGVIGPTRSGDCRGSCGQCVAEIREGTPAKGWTADMLAQFCDIWQRWHLNDMRPYCEHQKALGWDELAKKAVKIYRYRLTRETQRQKTKIEGAALNALRRGETFTPDAKMTELVNLPYIWKTHETLMDKALQYYEPAEALYPGDMGAFETKTLGWLSPEEHPEGLLGRECLVCGYRYGTAWKTETVPKDVIDWLFSLPDTPVEPAWV